VSADALVVSADALVVSADAYGGKISITRYDKSSRAGSTTIHTSSGVLQGEVLVLKLVSVD